MKSAGTKSDQTAASRLGMQLREWLSNPDKSCGGAEDIGAGSIDAWTAQCHLKLISTIATKHSGAFKVWDGVRIG